MKAFSLAAMILFVSTASMAGVCESRASRAAQNTVEDPEFRVEMVSCALAPNKKVTICDVSGSNGDGAGDKEYRVVLDRSCKKVYRIDLTGEE